MRAYWVLAAIMAVAIFSISSDHALAENRLALVIGNANYKNYSQIKTATQDATDIGAILNKAGFAVILSKDLSGSVMKQTVVEFNNLARDADLVVLYFVGQAIETNGGQRLRMSANINLHLIFWAQSILAPIKARM